MMGVLWDACLCATMLQRREPSNSCELQDARFEGLPGYDFASHHLVVNDTEGGSV
jgi:hypothetical protein